MTLTLEPRDLLGVDGSAGGPPTKGGGAALGSATKDGRGAKTEEVELRRRPGEGFGFVIASQEVANGSECLSAFLSFLSVSFAGEGLDWSLPAVVVGTKRGF